MCVRVRDAVTLGPLEGVEVEVRTNPQGPQKPQLVRACKTGSDGWCRVTADAYKLLLHPWTLHVRCTDDTPFRTHRTGVKEKRTLEATYDITFNKYDHTVIELLVDRDDLILPSKASIDAALELIRNSSYRVFVDDGANYGNQAAAVFLLHSLKKLRNGLGNVTVCASSEPIMGEEKLTTYIWIPCSEENLELRRKLFAEFVEWVRRGLERAFRDRTPPEVQTQILPPGVEPSLEITTEDTGEPKAYCESTTIRVNSTGTYDGLSGIGAEYILDQIRADLRPLPQGLDRNATKAASSYDTSELRSRPSYNYFQVVCESSVKPYQRTIRARFNQLSGALGELNLVDEFTSDDAEAFGLIGASDDVSSAEYAGLYAREKLRTPNLVALQPYRWKRDRNLWLRVKTDRGRTVVEPLPLPQDASYPIDVGADSPLGKWVSERPEPAKMFVYGLHQPHGTTAQVLFDNLLRALVKYARDNDTRVLVVVVFKLELPTVPEDVRDTVITGDDAQTLANATRDKPVAILHKRSLDQASFIDVLRRSTLPVVLEGANTMNMAMSFGLPFLSVSEATTEYPSLGKGDHVRPALRVATALLRREERTWEATEPDETSPEEYRFASLAEFFAKVGQDPWKDYFKSLSDYTKSLARDQLFLSLFRALVQQGKLDVVSPASCECCRGR